jgi:hypothetical protein
MAAPQFAPESPSDEPRSYESPDFVPRQWSPDRKAEITGFQPEGPQLGYQGPDQGYALTLAARFADRLHLLDGESGEDATSGCVALATRRASLFGRAPVTPDLTIAFTVWGFLDPDPPAALAELRRDLFEGIADRHHYTQRRTVVDMVPESTLRSTPQQITAAYPERWRELIGAPTVAET